VREPIVLDAVLYNLIVVGEAAKHLEEEARAKVPDVRWSDYAGLRNLLARTSTSAFRARSSRAPSAPTFRASRRLSTCSSPSRRMASGPAQGRPSRAQAGAPAAAGRPT
jgi:hypothetical protein